MRTTTVALLTLAGREAWWRVQVWSGRGGVLRARRLNARGRGMGKPFDLESVRHVRYSAALSHDDARFLATDAEAVRP